MTNQKTWQKLHDHPEKLRTYLMREKVIDAIRLFFKKNDFNEVETPLLAQHPGMEPFLQPFVTQLDMANGQKRRAFLLTNPEYAMKKLLVAGLPRIFQICKCFRNGEGISGQHNPEFTIMEWYRANADYQDIMRDCENLFRFILAQIQSDRPSSSGNQLSSQTAERSTADLGSITYHGNKYDLTSPWERLSAAEAFAKYADIDTETLLSPDELLIKARQKGYTITPQTTWEEIFNQIFLNEVEPHLGQGKPTILYDYPTALASLAKKKASDPRFTERFEFYIAGMELGNAFSELTDPDEQEQRLLEEEKQRAQMGKTTYQHDSDFIDALRVGMPTSGGIGVGIDRIIMLFADAATIEETLFFPIQDMFDLQ